VPRLDRRVAGEIVAVDGGSTDGTREALRALGVPIVDQARRGRGEAFRAGLAATRGEHVVFFSPDGNEDPGDLALLFASLEEGADVAIASRFLPGAANEEDEALLPARKWANQGFTMLANLLWNRGDRPVTDSINGFRGARRTALEALALCSSGFTIEYEMTIRALRRGLRIVEVPTREGPRVGGKTKAPSFRTGLAFLGYLAREIRRP
jgi:glycosyltransferase involved in cell wall biosynthesis